MTQHIASYLNRRGDIEATITQTDKGNYAVRIIDVDAEHVLPASVHFKTLDAAKAYALKCVTSDDDDELPL